MSQLELALISGISQRHLSCIETGRAKASPGTLHNLLGALDVPLERCLGPAGEGISAGQSQRLALARTLTGGTGPTLYLLDEPSAHLSPELVETLSAELRRRATAGHTVVVASHDVRLAAIADEVVYL